jgi:hypothetical protein
VTESSSGGGVQFTVIRVHGQIVDVECADAIRSPLAAYRRKALVEIACVHACERSIISRRRCGEHSTDRVLDLLTEPSTGLSAYKKSAA